MRTQHFPRFVTLVLAIALTGCGGGWIPFSADKKAPPPEPVPIGFLPAAVVPTHYKLDLTIRPKLDRFAGNTAIDVQFAEPRRSIYLHGKGLNVAQVSVRLANGKTIKGTYTQVYKTGVARLDFAKTVPAGAATLLFSYDAPWNPALSGLYKATDNGNAYVFSQFEATDARDVFPSFDQPGFKTPFDISVVAEVSDSVISNTPIVKTDPLGDGLMRVTFATTKPLPTYLVAFAVGPLDIVKAPDIPPTAYRTRPIPLRGVAVKGKGQYLAYALQATPALLTTLETYFGVSYPYEKLDIIAAADFAAGSMENAGAIVSRETRLLIEPDGPLQQKRDFTSTEAHEISHQWFGDLVTPRWWDDIWLNESFATWQGYKTIAVVLPNDEFGRRTIDRATGVMDLDSLPHARRVHEPVEDENGIATAFDGLTYQKGAAILSMFETYAGNAAFQKGVHTHLTRFAFKVATANDFLNSLAEGSGHPEIVPAFRTFLDQPGVPLVTAKLTCQAHAASVTLSQAPYTALGGRAPAGRMWRIPVCVRALPGGKKICTLLDKPQAELALGPVCPKAIMPNADGTGYYRFSADEAGWRALIGHDASLNPAERLVLAKNIGAAFRAGALPASVALPALERHAASDQWDLATSALKDLEFIRAKFLDDAARAKFEARLARLVEPQLRKIGLKTRAKEAIGVTLLRPALEEFLVRVIRAPGTVKALAPYGRDAVAGKAGIDSNLRESAIRAALIADGAAFEKTLVAAIYKSRDAQFRTSGLIALSNLADHAALEADVLPLVLSDQTRINEATLLLEAIVRSPDRRAEAWP